MMFERNMRKKGWIEVICGSMFSGKTEELLRRVKRATIAKQDVVVIKPLVDNRYHETQVVSHDKNQSDAIPVSTLEELENATLNKNVVAVDEAQFFDSFIVEAVKQLAEEGKRVIIAGLDMDYKGRPFGSMPDLLCIAEDITKVHAICAECGELANFSHRLKPSEELIELGEKDTYVPLCRHHFNLAINAE